MFLDTEFKKRRDSKMTSLKAPADAYMEANKTLEGVVTTGSGLQYKVIQQIIDRLEIEKPEINYDDICAEAEKQKLNRQDVMKVLDKLKQEGIIFEPRKNIYKKLL